MIAAAVIAIALFAGTIGYDMYRNNKPMHRGVVMTPAMPTFVVKRPLAPTTPPTPPVPSSVSQEGDSNQEATTPVVDTLYSNKELSIEFTHPSNAVIDTTSLPNGLWVTRGSDLKMQVLKYTSIKELGDYANASAYFRDREANKLMSGRTKTMLGGEVAYKYVDQGMTNVYTVLIPHADRSIHIVSFPNHTTRQELSKDELAMLLSIGFVK